MFKLRVEINDDGQSFILLCSIKLKYDVDSTVFCSMLHTVSIRMIQSQIRPSVTKLKPKKSSELAFKKCVIGFKCN